MQQLRGQDGLSLFLSLVSLVLTSDFMTHEHRSGESEQFATLWRPSKGAAACNRSKVGKCQFFVTAAAASDLHSFARSPDDLK